MNGIRKLVDEVLSETAAKWKKENSRASKLINAANWDLYQGPHSEDREYPGFDKAVREIEAALDDVGELWIDLQSGQAIPTKPDFDSIEEESGEHFDNAEDWYCAHRSEVITAITGKELAKYIN